MVGHLVGVFVRPVDCFFNIFEDFPMDAQKVQQAHADLADAHAQLGQQIAAGPTAINWQQVLQILILILQALGPIINPPAPPTPSSKP